MNRILLVDDDVRNSMLLKRYLEVEGFDVTYAPDGTAGWKMYCSSRPDLILLDWNLPDGEGAGFCRELRAHAPELPVLLLTVRSDTRDILAGFDCGADDYVTKPFDREVLYSRMLALLRRSRGTGGPVLQCAGIVLDENRQAVTCRGRTVGLGQLEYQLLRLLLQNKGRTVTRRQLLETLWDCNGRFVNDNTLTVTMKRLREKLGQPNCLKTIRSFGYRMEEEPW